jgi:hypothetical protein
MQSISTVAAAGNLGIQVSRGGGRIENVRDGGLDAQLWPPAVRFADILEHGAPQRGLSDEVNAWRLRNLRNLWRGARRIAAAKAMGIGHVYGALFITVTRGNGEVVPYGLASLRVVTDVGVGYIVDAFQNSVELENMKYHGYGTGATAESASQTALVTELTTQYASDSTRPTGTTTEGATANIYRTVATLSPDTGGTIAITEHGIFSASSSGVMLDRSVFSAVNLVAGSDSMTTTYDLTFPSGS